MHTCVIYLVTRSAQISVLLCLLENSATSKLLLRKRTHKTHWHLSYEKEALPIFSQYTVSVSLFTQVQRLDNNCKVSVPWEWMFQLTIFQWFKIQKYILLKYILHKTQMDTLKLLFAYGGIYYFSLLCVGSTLHMDASPEKTCLLTYFPSFWVGTGKALLPASWDSVIT